MDEVAPSDRLRIVFICTGNQARSVLAEHYTRKIGDGLPIEIESAGTLDTVGTPALEGAVVAGRSLGLDLSDHTSRRFDSIDLSTADLVIGFEHQHVATAVVDGGASPAKTFRLLELLRLLPGELSSRHDDLAAGRAAIARAASERSAESAFRPGEDLMDPVGQSTDFFLETARQIQEACDRLIRSLFPDRRAPSTTRDEGDASPRRSSSARIWD